MTRWVLLGAMLIVPCGYAEMQGAVASGANFGAHGADGVVISQIEPAAGPAGAGGLSESTDEPTLLDKKAEELKAEVREEESAISDFVEKKAEPQSRDDSKGAQVSASGMKVLSNSDARAYKDAFARARRGEFPNLKADDNVLLGEVRGVYLLNKKGAGFDELNSWLKEYRDLPLASAVYDEAMDKRERPREVCTTETVTQKVAPKKGAKNKDGTPKKATTKKVKKQVCKTVGKLGPAPIVPLAVEKRELRKETLAALRETELNKLSPQGRALVGQSWRLRGQKKYAEATTLLLGSGVRGDIGNEKWQAELVKIADYYHGQRDWKAVLRAAEPAAEVKGPERDEARWLAGYAHYLLDNKAEAAKQWEKLVRDEPVGSKHHARAAWWGARAYSAMKDESSARALLKEGAKDGISFYGQLCATRMGKPVQLDWSAPDVDARGFAQLQRDKGGRRGLALAQLGEIDMAQRQFRLAYEDLPYGATKALAAASVRMGLPATALYAGKQLREQGETVPPALFPLAEDWSPNGGWSFDRALMLGIMRQESAFNPQIGSRVGAQGLMQIMPATGKYIARLTGQSLPDRADLHDPGINLKLAQDYLKYLSNKLDGNMMLVVASYNGGIGNVQRWLSRGTTPGHDPVLWLESIPFDETRDYVEKVFGNYWLYQQRMKQTPWSLNALAEGYWPLQWNGNRKTALLDK